MADETRDPPTGRLSHPNDPDSHEDGHTHDHTHPNTQDHDHRHGHTHDHVHGFDDESHDHHGDELSPEQQEALAEHLWRLENVELTTVGVDVGSSTSHLMFARVHLRRLAEALSSRFVVVQREVLWRSPIMLTPYRADDTIDAEQLSGFVHDAYHAAGFERSDVDSGAVILTGEALKRTNARAIAALFAEESGKFVCASAGHHLEALMAAHGSGAVALSRQRHATLLNVDVGGGTSKFALIHDGEVLHTAAVAVGGRLATRGPDGRIARVEEPARQVARAAGIRLEPGVALDTADEARLVGAWRDVLLSLIRQEPASGVVAEVLVTEPLPTGIRPDAITFSGGVAEYIYGREDRAYDDFGPALAAAVRAALDDGRIGLPLLDPGQGIRATVIGASQFTVQLSGSTIAVSDPTILPLRNLPVLFPRLDLAADFSSSSVAREVGESIKRLDLADGDDPVALAFRWPGDPHYRRLRALAEGIRDGMPRSFARGLPLVLLLDRDVGRTLGEILKRDLAVRSTIVSVDGMQLKEFDYVDIGEVLEPTRVVPVVIKSLLFAGS